MINYLPHSKVITELLQEVLLLATIKLLLKVFLFNFYVNKKAKNDVSKRREGGKGNISKYLALLEFSALSNQKKNHLGNNEQILQCRAP